MVCTTLRSWVAHLREDPGLAQRAAHQWGRVAAGGGVARGPIAACVSALRLITWAPLGPEVWLDAAGDRVDLSCAEALMIQVRQACGMLAWSALARRRPAFAGLESGADVGASVRARPVPPAASGAARCIQAGGCWTQLRRHSADVAPSSLCPYCLEADESLAHRWWKCPAHAHIRVQTDGVELAHRALEEIGAGRDACLWLSGILPASASAVPASEPMSRVPLPPAPPGWADVAPLSAVIDVWTDGSCLHPAVPELSRAGWAVAFGPESPANLLGPVPGKAQTAQRAEVYAAVVALRATHGLVHVHTDSTFVVKGLHRVASCGTLPRAHRDLWDEATRWWRPGRSQVSWAPAHLTAAEAAARGVEERDWAGNALADVLARDGALQHALAAGDVQHCLDARALAVRVLAGANRHLALTRRA